MNIFLKKSDLVNRIVVLYCCHLKMFLKCRNTVSKTTISQITSSILCIVVSLLVGSCALTNNKNPKKVDIRFEANKKVKELKKDSYNNIREYIKSLTPQSDIKEISDVNDRIKSCVGKYRSKYREWYESSGKKDKRELDDLKLSIDECLDRQDQSITQLHNIINIGIQEYKYLRDNDDKNSKGYQKEITENLLLKLHKSIGINKNKSEKVKQKEQEKYYQKKTKLSFTPNKNTNISKMVFVPGTLLALSSLSFIASIPVTLLSALSLISFTFPLSLVVSIPVTLLFSYLYLRLKSQKISHFLFFSDYYNEYKYFSELDDLYKHKFPNGKYDKEWDKLKAEIKKQNAKKETYKFKIQDKKLKKLAKELNLEAEKKCFCFRNHFAHSHVYSSVEVKEIRTKDNKKLQTAYLEKRGEKVILLVAPEGSFNSKFETIKWKYSCFVVTNNSTRAPSKESVNIDYEAAFEYLVEEKDINPEDIIVMGYCRGAEAATHIARKYNPGKLILVSPPYKLKGFDFNGCYIVRKILKRLVSLIPENYNFAVGKLDKVTCPVHIMFDKKDEIFAYEKNGKKIFNDNRDKGTIKLHTFTGMGHDLFSYKKKYDKIKEVMFDIINESEYNCKESKIIYHK